MPPDGRGPRWPGLDGRVALVTGANHGIGAATAVELARNGARVLLTYYRTNHRADARMPDGYRLARASTADDVLRSIRDAGGSAESVETDLADEATIPKLFDRAEAAFGPVEILVNNASGWLADTFVAAAEDRFGRSLRSVDASTIDRQFAVDARGAALLIAEFARRHIQRDGTWGRIVGLTSGGPSGFPQEVSYGAAKAAQVNYTMSAAQELERYGVTANLVHPPVTDTGWVTPEVEAHIRESGDPLRIAQPSEVGEVIAFLACDLGRRITANVITLR